MAVLFFLLALVFSMPFPICAEGDDDTDWKPFESFTQYQIRKANDYFSTLNDAQKLDLFENWSGHDIGKKELFSLQNLHSTFQSISQIIIFICVKKILQEIFLLKLILKPNLIRTRLNIETETNVTSLEILLESSPMKSWVPDQHMVLVQYHHIHLEEFLHPHLHIVALVWVNSKAFKKCILVKLQFNSGPESL